ncbi:hypothetical protein RHGRI_008862 [Rhododendron griersonianum]|uniref:Cytochrome P450 n=1 Tax=Rhododendron griersonianum TaxID=479676 RepID=A0AAV6L3D9_9ERIC|nr:hypothetical protein RHGRI_008862 [Rhododendron griersonianum]
METWFIIVLISLCISAVLKTIFNIILSLSLSTSGHQKKLPPGPPTVPDIGNLLWLRTVFSEFPSTLRSLRAKYGPIFTLWVGSRPAIFIGTPTLAYRALVQNGAVFADRPEALAAGKIISNHQRNISSAGYGPTWRLLRRNLAAEILHPSLARSYSATRQ